MLLESLALQQAPARTWCSPPYPLQFRRLRCCAHLLLSMHPPADQVTGFGWGLWGVINAAWCAAATHCACLLARIPSLLFHQQRCTCLPSTRHCCSIRRSRCAWPSACLRISVASCLATLTTCITSASSAEGKVRLRMLRLITSYNAAATWLDHHTPPLIRICLLASQHARMRAPAGVILCHVPALACFHPPAAGAAASTLALPRRLCLAPCV